MSITRAADGVFHGDVVVVGAGLIGLACATAVARHGLRVLVISSNEPGAASLASAGILAPSVGHPPGPARGLGIAARDMYPLYVESLMERTDVRVALDRSGVLEVAFTEEDATSLRAAVDEKSTWIDGRALTSLEPALAPAAGAILHAEDGAVDAGALLTAVRLDAELDSRIALRSGRIVRIETGRAPLRAQLEDGDWVTAPVIIVAAGAWVSGIGGLPRPLPVTPLRGQMLSFPGAPLRHVVMGMGGYVVPRGDRSLVGSTMEHVGFDAGTTDEGAALLRKRAGEISEALGAVPVLEHWAGLRPVTPDFLPVVGRDPECEGLLYACGHSKNGVLLAPLTARTIAELITTGSASADVSAFAPTRFEARR